MHLCSFCSKGNDRAVTVFKQNGHSRRQANGVFELSFQEASVEILNNHFQVMPCSVMATHDVGTCSPSAVPCDAALQMSRPLVGTQKACLHED